MNPVERRYQKKLRNAERLAADLRKLYPNTDVNIFSEEQRRGSPVMRVRLYYETETFMLTAMVSVHSDDTYHAIVVADTYDPADQTFTPVVNVGRETIYNVADTLAFLKASIPPFVQQINA